MSIPVYIAIYAVTEGNYHHWAIYINQSQAEQHIYEVVGEHPSFQYNHIVTKNSSISSNGADSTEDIVSTTSKSHDGRHINDILVGHVTAKDVTKINQILPLVVIDNDTSGWCCQDWVLEALEELCAEYILDEDDELYSRGIRKAKQAYFGPIL